MIVIVDYGMGNLRSVQKGFEKVGAHAEILSHPDQIVTIERLVLPGVGAFADGMANLRRGGWVAPIKTFIERGRPFLGICLGMQLLFDTSEEFGPVEGLGILPGRVVRFTPDPAGLRKIPHMGWNALRVMRRAPHLAGVDDGTPVYFVHSYHSVPDDSRVVATTTEYGAEFVSSVWLENVFACQFHPEKSQAAGLRLLANFAALAGETGAAAAAR